MRRALAMLCGGAAFLSACSSSSGGAPVVSAIPTQTQAMRAPQVMRETGLESVIGEEAVSLARRFGEARIDLTEGDARKLQFVSERCVLDIYLYPLARNTAPVATHVEARQRVGGADADRAGCIADVERTARGG